MVSIAFDVPSTVGMVGVVLVLLAYFSMQIGRMDPKKLQFSLINLVGSLLILVSLCYHLNMPSLVIEVAWLFISAYGVFRCLSGSKTSVSTGDK
jgi:hypothetical protein